MKKLYSKYIDLMEKFGSPLLLLGIRILIGLVFLKSGLVKFSNVDSAILLFKYEYNVPILSPVFAAYSAMIFEIGCGALLIAGAFTRIAALPLVAMTLVIQFFVFQNPEHFYWLSLLLVLAIYGGGKISLDCLAKKCCGGCGK